MAEKTRSGFQAVRESYKSGHFSKYLDKATGEIISRRQYLKRTEKITSLESKAKQLKQSRLETGRRQPMTRYNAVVKQFKLANPGAKVRGNSPEAKHFQKLYEDLKKPRKGLQGNLRRLRVMRDLGLITQKEMEDSASTVRAHYA